MNILGLIDGLIGGQEDEHPEWYDANGKWKGPTFSQLQAMLYNGTAGITELKQNCGFGGTYEDSFLCDKILKSYKTSDYYRNHPNDVLSVKADGRPDPYAAAVAKEKEDARKRLAAKKQKCITNGRLWKNGECGDKPATKTLEQLAWGKGATYYKTLNYCKGKENTEPCKTALKYWKGENAAAAQALKDKQALIKKAKADCAAKGGTWTTNNTCVTGHGGILTPEQATKAKCGKYQVHDPDNPQRVIPYTYNTNVPAGKVCNQKYGLTQTQRAELTSYLGPKLDGAGADQGAFNGFFKKYITVDISHYPFTVKVKPSRVSSIVMANPQFKKLYAQFRHYLIADKTKHVSDWPAFAEHAKGSNNVMAEIAYKLLVQALNNGVIYGAPDNTIPSDTIDPNVPSIPQDTTEQAAVPTTYLPYVQTTSQQTGQQSHLWLYGGGALVIGLLGVAGYMMMKKRRENNE